MSLITPKETLYVHNLNEKVKKDELRRSLYQLFSTYGRIIEVRAYRKPGLRGQAFVAFRDVASATAALRKLNGFSFYDRPLAIEYAKSRTKSIRNDDDDDEVDDLLPSEPLPAPVAASSKPAAATAPADIESDSE
ncbi:hypothetical protein IWQ60_009320 [Tieghemiomyces parasiticus]|uniref:RRM domain-containing protein n=1 Tax=Tieghemiomyces parasiticus TaxID=78921 RepID=A0A9W7ZV44_9FUNG|nr:hypothetical protein IWQ60_009320 [Tieghemiomyces parasiticus]